MGLDSAFVATVGYANPAGGSRVIVGQSLDGRSTAMSSVTFEMAEIESTMAVLPSP